MYERLQEAHDRDLQRFAEERAGWQAAEAALRHEAAELRAQLLYAVAQLNALQAQVAAGGAMPPVQPGASSTASHYPAPAQPAALAGREPAAALPSASGSSASGLSSGAEQVKAVIDAMKPPAAPSSSWAAAAPPQAAPASSSSAAPVSPSAAWPEGAEGELPAYAADLAAAVAAVDATDVLSGISSYSLGTRKAAAVAEAPSSSAAAPAPAAEAPQQQPQQVQPAGEPEQAGAEAEQAAAVPEGPPPPLTLGADDIFWVNQVGQCAMLLGSLPACPPAPPGTACSRGAPPGTTRCRAPGLRESCRDIARSLGAA